MGGKARIANTIEEIQPGKVLINGTAHKIKQGKTRINGTIHNITFKDPVETGSATPGETWDFTSKGAFTVPCTGYYDIEIHGGGGGGGYGTAWSSVSEGGQYGSGGGQSGSGGGGSGSLFENIYLIYKHTYTIIIGAAGKGGVGYVSSGNPVAATDGGNTTIIPLGPNTGSTFKGAQLNGGGAGGSGGSFTQSRPESNQILDNNVGNLSTGGIIGAGGWKGGDSYEWSGSGSGGSGGCTFGSYGDGGDGSHEQFLNTNNKGQDGKAGAVRFKFIRRG